MSKKKKTREIPVKIQIPGVEISHHVETSSWKSLLIGKMQATGQRVFVEVLHMGDTPDQGTVDFFRDRGRILQKLRHPGIVDFILQGGSDRYHYLVYEMSEEKDRLADMLKAKSRILEPLRCFGIVQSIAGTLDYALSKCVVHGQIRPSNIIVMPDGEVKIRNFTVYRHSRDFVEDMIRRRPEYVSPEHLLFEKVDFRTDIYCLGLILHELLCGHSTYGGASREEVCRRHLEDEVPSLKEVDARYAKLDEMLRVMLAKRKEDRRISYETIISVCGQYQAKLRNPTLVERETATADPEGTIRPNSITELLRGKNNPVVHDKRELSSLSQILPVIRDNKASSAPESGDRGEKRGPRLVSRLGETKERGNQPSVDKTDAGARTEKKSKAGIMRLAVPLATLLVLAFSFYYLKNHVNEMTKREEDKRQAALEKKRIDDAESLRFEQEAAERDRKRKEAWEAAKAEAETVSKAKVAKAAAAPKNVAMGEENDQPPAENLLQEEAQADAHEGDAPTGGERLIGEEDQELARLASILEKGDADEKAGAVRRILETGGEKALPLLKKVFAEASTDMTGAAEAIGSTAAGKDILFKLAAAGDEKTSVAAFTAMVMVMDRNDATRLGDIKTVLPLPLQREADMLLLVLSGNGDLKGRPEAADAENLVTRIGARDEGKAGELALSFLGRFGEAADLRLLGRLEAFAKAPAIPLSRRLNDPALSAAVRQRMIRVLGSSRDAGVLKPLVELLEDQHCGAAAKDAIRGFDGAAAEAVAASKAESSVKADLLRTMTGDIAAKAFLALLEKEDATKAKRLVSDILEKPGTRPEHIIRFLAGSQRKELRQHMVGTLLKKPNADFSSVYIDLLDNESPSARKGALEILCGLPKSTGSGAADWFLASTFEDVQRQILGSGLKDADGRIELLKQAACSTHQDIRVQAFKALGDEGGEEAEKIFLDRITKEESAKVKQEIVRSFSSKDRKTKLDFALILLCDQTAQFQAVGRKEVENASTEKDLEKLAAFLKSETAMAAKNAVLALLMKKKYEKLPELIGELMPTKTETDRQFVRQAFIQLKTSGMLILAEKLNQKESFDEVRDILNAMKVRFRQDPASGRYELQ